MFFNHILIFHSIRKRVIREFCKENSGNDSLIQQLINIYSVKMKANFLLITKRERKKKRKSAGNEILLLNFFFFLSIKN